MTIIELDAYVTEDGELRLKLPPNISADHFRLRLELVPIEDETVLEDTEWTDEEIAEMMRSEPKTGAEIADSDVIGSWAHKGITDSVEFVENLRRKCREKRTWR
jgi:hypothetical protein